MKQIVAREEYCIGCRLCEINCIVHRSQSKNIITAFRHEREDLTPSVVVESSGLHSFAVQCRHCVDAPCVEACITGAMTRDPETGAVICDTKRCVSCWSCIMVCPAGAVLRGASGKPASKCDQCAGESEPCCVAGCPNAALKWEEVND
jgi:carbon-monoxide dehydrogenase iron sulfur subunit